MGTKKIWSFFLDTRSRFVLAQTVSAEISNFDRGEEKIRTRLSDQ